MILSIFSMFVCLPVRLSAFLAFGWSKRFFEFLILVLGDTGRALSLSFVPVFACLLSCYVSFVTDGHVDSFLIRRQLLECMCVSFGPPAQRSSERPFTLYAIRIYNIYLPHFEKWKVERKCEQEKGVLLFFRDTANNKNGLYLENWKDMMNCLGLGK